MYPKHDPCSHSPEASFEKRESQHPRLRNATNARDWSQRFAKLAVLALTALTTGCLGTPIYVDHRFTPEEEKSIQAAADVWAESTNGKGTVDLVFGARVDLRDTGRRVMVRAGGRAAENAYELFREGDPGGRHESWDSEVIVIVPERMVGIDLEYVVTHELGHHFGIHHVSDETAIMYFQPNPKSAHCLTREDLTAFCAANTCNPESMTACDDKGSILR
jgi:matrixin